MNSDKLNSIIKKKSNGNANISLHLHQMFFFEHVLMRLEKSKYKNNIILKGGVLLSSMIGEDLRTTKDIDASLKSVSLNIDNIKNIFTEILNIDIGDNIYFEMESIKDIRLEDEYGGFKINVKGIFEKIKSNFFIEITSGDIITPREINYKYKSIFEDKYINIMTYTIETIIAEKFESIISKNIFTTRGKDFYDIYMLINKKKNNIDNEILVKAIKNTFDKRNTKLNLDYIKEVLDIIKTSKELEKMYNDYQVKLDYTKDITFKKCIDSLYNIYQIIKDN